MLKNCKICKVEYYTWSNLQTKCPKCTPRIPAKGKRGKTYDYWLKTEARPLYIAQNGDYCQDCKTNKGYDMHHLKARNSHAKLKYDITNLIYLCRICHQKRHNINW